MRTTTRWVRLEKEVVTADGELKSREPMKVDAGSRIGTMFVGQGAAESVTVRKRETGETIRWIWKGDD